MTAPVSIIIPTYNRHDFLRQVLPTYLIQRDVLEVLIIDDGSTPPVEPGLADLLAEHDHLRVIRHTRSLGSCMARNTGIREARAEFVFFGEDDLIIPEDHVRILLQERERLGADLICGQLLQQNAFETFGEALTINRRRHGPIFDQHHITVQTQHITAELELPFAHAIFLGPRDLLLRYQFTGHLGGPSFLREDGEIQLQLRRAGYRLFGTPATASLHLARHHTEGSGTRSGRSVWVQVVSSALNSWLVVNEYYDEISPFFPGQSRRGMRNRILLTTIAVGLKRRARSKSKLLNNSVIQARKYI